ncbi:MAG: acyl-CoA/acyl-ACP dehydrogenase [Candidatus Rokubacteria bacterium]|nr:acyl-CoA/acyl-ACP dehydrogenase [Candidatus Rokubacteria bacterium]
MTAPAYPSLTDEQRRLIELVRALGRDRFAPRAAKYDLEASFPFENYADLREHGLLGLTIPRRHGGLGADYATYALVSAELGRWCGTTALTFNMHACSMLWPSQMADDLPMADEERQGHERRRAGIYARVVRDGALFAQPFSEPNSAAAAGQAPFGTTARPVDGGWRVNGVKHFASLAGAAHYYGLLCTEDREGIEPSMKDTLYLAVPADAPGAEVFGAWDPLGMRGTVSRSLRFRDVFVPEEHAMLPRGAYYRAALAWPHMFMTLCPTYLGIARAAFDFTVAYLRGEAEGAPRPGLRGVATKQLAVAQMRIVLEQAEALLHRAVLEARVNPTKDERLRAYAAQYTVMEHANEICRLAIRTCGGRSIFRSLPLERLYRDSRCGSLMLPWTAEICTERLGRESLFEPGEQG